MLTSCGCFLHENLCWSLFLILTIGEFFRARILQTAASENVFIKIIDKENYVKKIDFFNINIRNKVEMFSFIPWLVSREVWIHSHTIFLWHGEKRTLNTKCLLELIKRRSKVQQTNMSCGHASNVDPWKTFSENYNERLIMACLQIYRELLSLTTFLRVHSNSKEVSYLSWQNAYSNLKLLVISS